MPEHEDITGSGNIHEEKHISDATTADAGKVVTPSGASNGVGVLRQLALNELDTVTNRTPMTGWEFAHDSTYTSGSPLAITGGVRTKITNDGVTLLEQDLPESTTNLWDTVSNKIVLPFERDLLHFRLTFTVETAATSAYLDFDVDIGGATGVIFEGNRVLTKVSPDFNRFVITAPLYGDSVFLANGAEIYVTPSHDVELYDIRLLVSKLHHGGS